MANKAHQTAGADKRDEAKIKDDASHATAKAGPYTVSASGVARDDPQRSEGSWNQTIGSAKESLGGLVGAEGLRQEGREQNRQGQGQEAQGQLSDLGGGVTDRVKGAVGGAAHGVTGNREEQARYQDMHDKGKTMQRGVEADMQKQNP